MQNKTEHYQNEVQRIKNRCNVWLDIDGGVERFDPPEIRFPYAVRITGEYATEPKASYEIIRPPHCVFLPEGLQVRICFPSINMGASGVWCGGGFDVYLNQPIAIDCERGFTETPIDDYETFIFSFDINMEAGVPTKIEFELPLNNLVMAGDSLKEQLSVTYDISPTHIQGFLNHYMQGLAKLKQELYHAS